MHAMQGLVLKASNTGQEAHGAFDGAADKIDTQLRRYTRRLKDRNAGQATAAAIPGAKLVTYPGMGHNEPRELWDSFIAEIVEVSRRAA